jgi:AcrR family transcriptional regulator
MQKRAEITGAALLRAAAAVFARVGYADARLNTITTRAQVSKGALYDHYSSKEDLARAVIEAGSARFQLACRPFLTSRIPAFEALIGISSLLVDPAVNDVSLWARTSRSKNPMARSDSALTSSSCQDGTYFFMDVPL